MASAKRYFGWSWIVCLILAIFPLTNWIFGTVARFQRGNTLGGIIWLIAGLTGIGTIIIWLIDLVTMIVKKDITVLA